MRKQLMAAAAVVAMSFGLGPLPPQPASVRAYAGSEIIAGVRAEAISYGTPPAGQDNAHRQAVDATIEVTEPTGADTLAVLTLGGYEFTARLGPDVNLRSGQKAELTIDLSKLVCFDPQTQKLIA